MADIFEIILLLKSSPMFEQVLTEDLRYIAQSMEPENYLLGERVFDLGENGDFMYVILSGRIGISLSDQPKIRDFIVELGVGDCFGEMNLLDGLPRSATAHVLEDSVLLTLEKNHLHGLIVHYPELALGILKGLSLQLRNTNLKK